MNIITQKEAKNLGLVRYFTGKACPKGHISERYVSTWGCCACGTDVNNNKKKSAKRHFVSNEYIFSCVSSCLSYAEFRELFPLEYGIAAKRGFLKKIQSTLGIGATTKKWDEDLCIKEGKKYKSRSKFSKGSSGAYDAAQKMGILDNCCEHMERPQMQNNAVYIWGGQVEEVLIVKVGVTSERLKDERIKSVIKRYGGPVDFCFIVLNKRARDVEKGLLSFGKQVFVGNINGSTEFRSVSWGDLTEMYAILLGAKDGTKKPRMV